MFNSNHGTFAFAQIASLYGFVGDLDRAKEALNEFYNGIYQNQISATGDQYYESLRARPYHYRAFNLMALIINARVGDWVGLDSPGWDRKTTAGTGMVDALNFAMSKDPLATDEEDQVEQLALPVASIINHFGDPDGRYTAFLYSIDPYYINQPWFSLSEGVGSSNIKWGVLEMTYGAVPAQPTHAFNPILTAGVGNQGGQDR